MITIGIPIRNSFTYAERLLRSLKNYTSDAIIDNLIIIDDGSRPAVKKTTLSYNLWNNTILIRNEESKGFPGACNQIFKTNKSEFVCILNSDTVVSPWWLEHMFNYIVDHKDVAVVGPSTSYANDPQCRRDICGRRHTMFQYDVEKYAIQMAKTVMEPQDIGSVLTGFCMLIRKSCLDKVGMFDEGFGLGSFEEADLCKRFIKAGYRCVWIPKAYVHHYGKRTFEGEKSNWKPIWEQNQKRFEEKWKDK